MRGRGGKGVLVAGFRVFQGFEIRAFGMHVMSTSWSVCFVRLSYILFLRLFSRAGMGVSMLDPGQLAKASGLIATLQKL